MESGAARRGAQPGLILAEVSMRRAVLPLLSALALLVPTLAAAQARTAVLTQVGLPLLPDNTTVAMKPSTRAWCLTAPSATKGAVVSLSACTPLQGALPPSQRFSVVRMGTGPIKHLASGLCVDVRQTDGKLLLWDCHGGWNQQFTNTRGDELKLAKNNTCLDVPAGRAAEGVQPIAYRCQGSVNQRWLQTSN
jgi:hypothetical protein